MVRLVRSENMGEFTTGPSVCDREQVKEVLYVWWLQVYVCKCTCMQV